MSCSLHRSFSWWIVTFAVLWQPFRIHIISLKFVSMYHICSQVKSVCHTRVTAVHFVTTRRHLLHLKVLALFPSSAGDLERLGCMASCMGSKWPPTSSRGPSTGLKNFTWLQTSMVLGILMTWYSGTNWGNPMFGRHVSYNLSIRKMGAIFSV